MIKLFVMSEWMAKDIGKFNDKTLVISITSPGSEHPKLEGKHIFQFHFFDIREPLEFDDGKIWLPMSEIVADEIVKVAINNKDKKIWVIHCEAGISRSPGVAIALSRFFEFDNTNTHILEKDFPCFNPHVRKLVEGAFIKRLKEEEKALELGG